MTGRHGWPHFPEAIVTFIASLGLGHGRKGTAPEFRAWFLTQLGLVCTSSGASCPVTRPFGEKKDVTRGKTSLQDNSSSDL